MTSRVQGTAARGHLSAALVQHLHLSPAPALALQARGVLTATGRAAAPVGSSSSLRQGPNPGEGTSQGERGAPGSPAFDSGPSCLLQVGHSVGFGDV